MNKVKNKKRLRLSFAQYYAINVLRVRKKIAKPFSCYFHPNTAKSLIRHGIAKMEGNNLVLKWIYKKK